MTNPADAVDESLSTAEKAVTLLFENIAARGVHTEIGPRLDELGWAEFTAEHPIPACKLLFRTQGRTLAVTDCLNGVMLAELAPLLHGSVNGIVLPEPTEGSTPGSNESRVKGFVLGPATGRLVVPVSAALGTVSIGVVDADRLQAERIDTFDPSVAWTRVRGTLDVPLVEASTHWGRAVGAAHRALSTELVALAEQTLQIAIERISAREQFGTPVGQLQSPRHALAAASATIAGAKVLLEESWRYGGRLSGLTAKTAAGRAHRSAADAALQVCGPIGLTTEHTLHRYVSRGFQMDALFGSYDQLESQLAEYLFDMHAADLALPPPRA